MKQILVCLLLWMISTADASASGGSSSVPIANFEQVTGNLWRGARPDEQGLDWLAQNGVKTVIDLRVKRSQIEAAKAQALGLHYVSIPLGYMSPPKSSIEQFLRITDETQTGKVFVHCRQGQDRTGTLVGIYRMVVQDWSFQQAYAEMRRHGFRRCFFALKEAVEESRHNFHKSDQSRISSGV